MKDIDTEALASKVFDLLKSSLPPEIAETVEAGTQAIEAIVEGLNSLTNQRLPLGDIVVAQASSRAARRMKAKFSADHEPKVDMGDVMKNADDLLRNLRVSRDDARVT